MLAITLNERITGNFTEAGVCSLSLAEFKRFIKTWIQPAEEKKKKKKQILDYMETYSGEVKDIRKRQLALSGIKSAKTENKKIVSLISKAEKVVLQQADNEHYLLTDSYIAIKLTAAEVKELSKDNLIIKDLLLFLKKPFTKAAYYSKKHNDIIDNYGSLTELFQQAKENALQADNEIDFTYAEYVMKENKDDISTYTAGDVTVQEKYIKLFKNKKFYTCGSMKPIYQAGSSYEVIILPVVRYNRH